MVRQYYANAFDDIQKARRVYPFITSYLPPTVAPTPIRLKAIAVNKELIEMTHASVGDFIEPFSRELSILIPFDYKKIGCEVYGGKWIEDEKIATKYLHFNGKREDGSHLLCVGVPDSFIYMENVILENIRTAEKMLIAYELYLTGRTKTLELNAYSHGNRGKNEFEKDTKKYKRY